MALEPGAYTPEEVAAEMNREPESDAHIAALVDAVRESGIALRPGDVLAVRLPLSFNQAELKRARDYGQAVERDTGLKVAFVPGEEFAHTTVSIQVTMHGGDSAQLAAEIRKVMAEDARRHSHRNRIGGGSPAL